LVRCLFGETFGAYQAAQLRRLLARPGHGRDVPAADPGDNAG
jgi:hypothetical protein